MLNYLRFKLNYNENSSSWYWLCWPVNGHTFGAASLGGCRGCDSGEGGDDEDTLLRGVADYQHTIYYILYLWKRSIQTIWMR